MTTDLHYSPTALLLRCAGMPVTAAVVIVDFVAHAHGGFPRVFGLGFVPSAVLIATALYLVGVTMMLTLGLMRHGGVALAATDDGLTIHSTWFSKTLAWGSISRVSMDVRYTKANRYTVAAVHEASGVIRCHAINTRLLAETLDSVVHWIDGAEHQRIANGGTPYRAPESSLAGYNARVHASDLAADIASARNAGGRQPLSSGEATLLISGWALHRSSVLIRSVSPNAEL